LSEVERGQKEASSELVQAIADALDVPLSQVLLMVSEKLEAAELVTRLPVVRTRAVAAA
jgi:transcriptional regulator with XRE-family HTH domain